MVDNFNCSSLKDKNDGNSEKFDLEQTINYIVFG